MLPKTLYCHFCGKITGAIVLGADEDNYHTAIRFCWCSECFTKGQRLHEIEKRMQELIMGVEEGKEKYCPRCDFEMKVLNTCHLVCINCGMNLDCSDKGYVW